eukprot:scaffold7744_cov76-Skeletonema_dohrnii-CCMP3373.AAC.3
MAHKGGICIRHGTKEKVCISQKVRNRGVCYRHGLLSREEFASGMGQRTNGSVQHLWMQQPSRERRSVSRNDHELDDINLILERGNENLHRN